MLYVQPNTSRVIVKDKINNILSSFFSQIVIKMKGQPIYEPFELIKSP